MLRGILTGVSILLTVLEAGASPSIPEVRVRTGANSISRIPLRDYLARVLKGEMPAKWPKEALKAQAVAARTYTLFQMKARARAAYQLESTVLDQVLASTEKYPVEKIYYDVVDETEGLVLVENHKLIKAYYHADCGGHTEEPQRVWGAGDRIPAVADSNCPFSPKAHWTLRTTLQELHGRLKVSHGDLGSIRSLKILSRTPSGRVAMVAVNGVKGSAQLSGQELREAMGFTRLKSALFEMHQDGNGVTFEGKGFGHGSGLCQWGARALAQTGKDFKSILGHYYSSARIARLNWRETL